jgi:hypothetical protein
MRASRWLLAIAPWSLVFAISSGCGAKATGSGLTDSGAADVTTDRASEGTPEAASEAALVEDAAETAPPQDATCAVDADIATLSAPDAALGDTGASTGGCFSCIQSRCSVELVACDSTCACKTEVVAFLACIASGGDATTCGIPLVIGGSSGLPLAKCVVGPALGGTQPGCLQACGASPPAGGAVTEGGADGASGDAGGE